ETDPRDLSPEEFAHRVRTEVEDEGTRIVMIDGVDGYRLSLRGDRDELVRKLDALCGYLTNVGVTVLLTVELSKITGTFRATDYNISYLADNLLFLRYLELEGELQKAIGVLKKRMSDFERTLREFEITERGIRVGEPLTGLRGILNGTPQWADEGGNERGDEDGGRDRSKL
ncbi:MAG: ATPase domain-containing protein, partial [Salinigranum sp.]